MDGVIGNSSSGIIEVPSFKKGTINIGDRQRGRIRAKSIIDCKPTEKSIDSAIKKLYSEKFQNGLKNTTNPYGNGGAVESILAVLQEFPLSNILQKKFFDVD